MLQQPWRGLDALGRCCTDAHMLDPEVSEPLTRLEEKRSAHTFGKSPNWCGDGLVRTGADAFGEAA